MRTGWQRTEQRREGIKEEKGEEFTGTITKDTWTITRGGWKQGREVGLAGVVVGGERQKTVLEQH